jgi:hypothetical protein
LKAERKATPQSITADVDNYQTMPLRSERREEFLPYRLSPARPVPGLRAAKAHRQVHHRCLMHGRGRQFVVQKIDCQKKLETLFKNTLGQCATRNEGYRYNSCHCPMQ